MCIKKIISLNKNSISITLPADGLTNLRKYDDDEMVKALCGQENFSRNINHLMSELSIADTENEIPFYAVKVNQTVWIRLLNMTKIGQELEGKEDGHYLIKLVNDLSTNKLRDHYQYTTETFYMDAKITVKKTGETLTLLSSHQSDDAETGGVHQLGQPSSTNISTSLENTPENWEQILKFLFHCNQKGISPDSVTFSQSINNKKK